MLTTLAQVYGFEGTFALTFFGVGVAVLVLLVALFVRASIRMWVIAAMFFFACLSYGVKYDAGVPTVNITWMLPVQMYRADLYVVMGILLSMFALAGARGFKTSDLPAQGFIFLLIGLYAGVLRVVHEGPVEGLQSVGFALATILPAIVTIPTIIKNFEDCLRLLRVMMFVSAIWAACCAVQFVVNPQVLLAQQQGGRFLGMTANAQFSALQTGFWSCIAIWLLLNDPKTRMRPIWLGLVGINLIFTAWSGSRMGALIVVTGSTFVLASRIGRAVLFLPLIALVTFGLYLLSDQLFIADNIERLVSSEDTRSYVWYSQFTVGMENPIFGTGVAEGGGSENSYLLGFSAYGFGMVVLLLTVLVATAIVVARLHRRRRLLPPDQRPIVDLIIGFNVAFFLAALFDGMLVSRIGGALFFMLMFSGISLRVSQMQDEAAVAGHHPDEEYGEHDEEGASAEHLPGEAAHEPA